MIDNNKIITPKELTEMTSKYNNSIFEFNDAARKAAQKGDRSFIYRSEDEINCPFFVIIDLLPSMGYEVAIDREVLPIDSNSGWREVAALAKITVSW